jgi:hypothetical protein
LYVWRVFLQCGISLRGVRNVRPGWVDFWVLVTSRA